MNFLKRQSWIQAVIAVVLLVLLIMVQGGTFATDRVKPGYTTVEQQLLTKLNATVIEMDSPIILEESGIVCTRIKADISPRITGLITTVEVDSGDMVEAGQVLVRIDNETQLLHKELAERALAQANSAIRQAEELLSAHSAAFEQAEKNYKRIQNLHKTEVSPEQQLEEAESKYRQAKAMMSSAEEGIKVAKLEKEKALNAISDANVALSWSILKAPFAGIVANRYLDPGEMAVIGKPIVTLNDISQYEVIAHVRETLNPYVKLGDELHLKIGEQETVGIIREIVPRIDPASRSLEIRISFPAKRNIMLGAYARVFINVGKEKNILIPKQFVRQIGQLATVLVGEDRGIKPRHIRTGNEKGGWVEIRSGLKKGETIFLEEK